MKLCDTHLDALMGEIEKAGLLDLVTEDQDAAMERVLSLVQGGETMTNFDPLYGAFTAIAQNTTNLLGVGLFAFMGDENACLICVTIEDHRRKCSDPECRTEDEIQRWPEYAVAEQVQIFEALKERETRIEPEPFDVEADENPCGASLVLAHLRKRVLGMVLLNDPNEILEAIVRLSGGLPDREKAEQ